MFTKQKRKISGFTMIEMMLVVVILGILVAVALPNFIAAQDRARYASLKNSMHIVQIASETYSFSYGGTYAGKNTELINHAKAAANNYYWKDIYSPFTKTVDPVSDVSSIITFFDAKQGHVYYAGSESVASGYAGGLFGTIDRSTYIIYAVDRNSTFLTRAGKVFFLNNNN